MRQAVLASSLHSRANFARLSQATASFKVVVVDPRGTPFPGAKVTLQGGNLPVTTDPSGTAVFPSVIAGQATVQVDVQGYTLRQSGGTDQTMFVRVPVCAPMPLMTTAEILALAFGAGATAGGITSKYKILEVVGELFIGGAIWNVIYRHSCR